MVNITENTMASIMEPTVMRNKEIEKIFAERWNGCPQSQVMMGASFFAFFGGLGKCLTFLV